MAQSKFLWVVEYSDNEYEFIRAQNVYQIIECPLLSQDADSIIKIEQLELASLVNEDNVIDIPFQD